MPSLFAESQLPFSRLSRRVVLGLQPVTSAALDCPSVQQFTINVDIEAVGSKCGNSFDRLVAFLRLGIISFDHQLLSSTCFEGQGH